MGRWSSPQMTTLTLPVHKISESVLGPTRGPEERVTPASPNDGAASAASTKTSATVTALPVCPGSPVPVNESKQIEVKASTRR